MNIERKRVLVGFGDVRGFTVFTRRAMNSPEEKNKFIQMIYTEFEKMAWIPEYHIKYTGDGVMILQELEMGPSTPMAQKVLDFLKHIYVMGKEVNSLIQASYPRPEGFRVRVACGTAFKLLVAEGGGGRRKRIPEYVDYPISLADRLLEVYATEHLAICHESVAEMLNHKKNGIKLLKLDPPKVCPHGIDEEDLKGLWSFSFEPEKPSP